MPAAPAVITAVATSAAKGMVIAVVRAIVGKAARTKITLRLAPEGWPAIELQAGPGEHGYHVGITVDDEVVL